eukprot:7149557-Pyramimonas_sp.AAC.1
MHTPERKTKGVASSSRKRASLDLPRTTQDPQGPNETNAPDRLDPRTFLLPDHRVPGGGGGP